MNTVLRRLRDLGCFPLLVVIASTATADRVPPRQTLAPHELRAAIEDDGRGFSAEKPDHSGSGIRSMQERVALLGGVFRLASIAGKGTQVEIQIPLEGTQSAHSG